MAGSQTCSQPHQPSSTLPLPQPPTTDTHWSNIGFESKPFNGHAESTYHASTGVWSPPELVADPFIRIHGLAPALNYGQQAFEGLKAFRSPTGDINIFRPQAHAQRLAHSCSVVSIPPIPESHFLSCVRLAVSSNAAYVPPHDAPNGAALYIRPVAFSSCGHLPLTPAAEYTFCVYVQPLNAYHGSGVAADALVLDEFDRAAPAGTGDAKVGGNYAPVLRWSEKAKSEGFDITLHLDSKTRAEVDEFSSSGFIGVKKRVSNGQEADGREGRAVLVVPDSKSAIRSVTSMSCIEIAEKLGWEVQVRPVRYEELRAFDEVIAVSTAAGLVPIRSITRWSTNDKFAYIVGTGAGGPCYEKLLRILRDIQRGIEPDTFGWCENVLPSSTAT